MQTFAGWGAEVSRWVGTYNQRTRADPSVCAVFTSMSRSTRAPEIVQLQLASPTLLPAARSCGLASPQPSKRQARTWSIRLCVIATQAAVISPGSGPPTTQTRGEPTSISRSDGRQSPTSSTASGAWRAMAHGATPTGGTGLTARRTKGIQATVASRASAAVVTSAAHASRLRTPTAVHSSSAATVEAPAATGTWVPRSSLAPPSSFSCPPPPAFSRPLTAFARL